MSDACPNETEWTTADSVAAADEGWGIMDADGSEQGRTQLQRVDETGVFDGDAAAMVYVRDTPSDLHAKALALVARYNPAEYVLILGAQA